MIDLTNYKTGRLVTIFIVLFIGCLLIFPYLSAEYYSYKYRNSLDQLAICEKNINYKQKGIGSKLIYYSDFSRTAEMFCFYENKEFNSIVKLEKQVEWNVVYTIKVNQDKYFYYPLYL
jgi:hypothetical protein